MGISLVTPGLQTAASSTASAAQSSADSPAGGFADVLSLQLVDLAQLLSKLPAQATDSKATVKPEEEASADPAEILALMPPLGETAAPVVTPQPATPITAKSGDSAEDKLLALNPDSSGKGKEAPLPALPPVSTSSPVQPGKDSASTTELLSGNKEAPATANIAASVTGDTPRSDFASVLAAQAAHGTHRSSAANAITNPTAIPTPLQDVRWAQDFGEKVVWMARNDQQSAQISINPPQLGPLQISLNMNGDQATAVFTSAHAEVRQAIEDAMPRLREMLAGAGIDLGQANVGSQSTQQQPGQRTASQDTARFSGDNAILGGDSSQTVSASVSALRSGRGMVDLFA